jgi:hypothetical protein
MRNDLPHNKNQNNQLKTYKIFILIKTNSGPRTAFIFLENNKMKVFLPLAMLILASSSGILEVEELNVGQQCQSTNGFAITSYSVTPFPPSNCSPQMVTMMGTFKVSACPHIIYIHEIYNQQHVYNQMVRVEGCFASGQNATFTFNVSPFQCTPGSYLIQTSLQSQDEGSIIILSCWQYQYQF